MPGFNIHLSVAKRYAEKHNEIKNLDDFYKGALAPDLVENKKVSHYTTLEDKNNLVKHLENKVSLENYLKSSSVKPDYEKGVFLHLITDYLFFNKFFEKEYLKNVSFNEFWNDLYYSYDETNEYLVKKYGIDYNSISSKVTDNVNKNKASRNLSTSNKNILDISKLDRFIEEVSDVSLKEYENKILKKIEKNKVKIREATIEDVENRVIKFVCTGLRVT